MTIGAKVRTLRNGRGLTAEQLAVRAGVSSSTVGRLERVDAVPSLKLLERIALELGTDASSLLSEAS